MFMFSVMVISHLMINQSNLQFIDIIISLTLRMSGLQGQVDLQASKVTDLAAQLTQQKAKNNVSHHLVAWSCAYITLLYTL